MTRALLVTTAALCAGAVLMVPAAPEATGASPASLVPLVQLAPAAPTEDDKLAEKVKDAIDKGIDYLKKQQDKKDGHWESTVFDTIAGLKGGTTSLATLALLTAGLKPDDPAIAAALKYLEKIKPDKTYVVALQTMVFAETRDKKYLPRIQDNVEWFKKTVLRDKEGRLQGWSYPGNAVSDNSNTQYALLGLYAAKTAGAVVDEQLWRDITEFYTRTQRPEGPKAGYWTYHPGGLGEGRGGSFTMTVGGVCGLWIANMGLGVSEQQLDEKTGVAAACGKYPDDDALAKGTAWVTARFNFQEGKSYFYNYYGIERLGRLSGQRFIGKIDWYREGCKRLLEKQKPDGSFNYNDNETNPERRPIDNNQQVITTSFALLFLSKGRTPVLVTKFAWGAAREVGNDKQALLEEQDVVEFKQGGGVTARTPNWNRKHNDCRNIVDFASREIFDNVPLAWQVFDPRLQDLSSPAKIDAEVGTLLQSPLLYLNGHGKLPFVGKDGEILSTEEQILKRYVEEGGFIIAEACCGDKQFEESFRDLMVRIAGEGVVDKNTGRLHLLPFEHAIWRTFPGISPADFPELRYVDRGCRTVAVFSPEPLAGYWEERRFMPADGRAPKSRGEKAYCLARNVIAYATGMEVPKPRLTHQNIVRPVEAGVARSKFRALQLKYISDRTVQLPPAPDSLRNLMQYLGQNARLDVALTSEVLEPKDAQIVRFKFLYLHGRKPIGFVDDRTEPTGFAKDEITNIRACLDTGGMLFADAACNDVRTWQAFDKSFRAAMKQLYPTKSLELIPLKGPDGREERFFKIAREAGIDLGAVRCRRETTVKGPDGKERVAPEPEMRPWPVHLEGIRGDDGRWVVIYSKYDIGCAIEGHKAGHCLGYDKESALRIASAVALYSLKR